MPGLVSAHYRIYNDHSLYPFGSELEIRFLQEAVSFM